MEFVSRLNTTKQCFVLEVTASCFEDVPADTGGRDVVIVLTRGAKVQRTVVSPPLRLGHETSTPLTPRPVLALKATLFCDSVGTFRSKVYEVRVARSDSAQPSSVGEQVAVFHLDAAEFAARPLVTHPVRLTSADCVWSLLVNARCLAGSGDDGACDGGSASMDDTVSEASTADASSLPGDTATATAVVELNDEDEQDLSGFEKEPPPVQPGITSQRTRRRSSAIIALPADEADEDPFDVGPEQDVAIGETTATTTDAPPGSATSSRLPLSFVRVVDVIVTLPSDGHPLYVVQCESDAGGGWQTKNRFAAFRQLAETVDDVAGVSPFPPTWGRSKLGLRLRSHQIEERRELLKAWLVSILAARNRLNVLHEIQLGSLLGLSERNFALDPNGSSFDIDDEDEDDNGEEDEEEDEDDDEDVDDEEDRVEGAEDGASDEELPPRPSLSAEVVVVIREQQTWTTVWRKWSSSEYSQADDAAKTASFAAASPSLPDSHVWFSEGWNISQEDGRTHDEEGWMYTATKLSRHRTWCRTHGPEFMGMTRRTATLDKGMNALQQLTALGQSIRLLEKEIEASLAAQAKVPKERRRELERVIRESRKIKAAERKSRVANSRADVEVLEAIESRILDAQARKAEAQVELYLNPMAPFKIAGDGLLISALDVQLENVKLRFVVHYESAASCINLSLSGTDGGCFTLDAAVVGVQLVSKGKSLTIKQAHVRVVAQAEIKLQFQPKHSRWRSDTFDLVLHKFSCSHLHASVAKVCVPSSILDCAGPCIFVFVTIRIFLN